MPPSRSSSDAPGVLVVGLAYRDLIERRGGVVVQAIGGVCINVASHLARSGLDVELATLLDPGAAGDELAAELVARGLALRTARAPGSVGCYHVLIDDGEPRPLAVTHPDGEIPAEFVVALRDRLAARPGHLVLELGASRTLVDAALGAARAARVPCVGLPTRVAEVVDWPGLLASLDVVVLNRQEAAAMLGRGAIERHDALAAGRALCGLGARAVVLTLGAAGAVAVEAGHASWHEAPDVAVVSSLGAGDALAAGVVAGLVGGLSLSRAVDAAMPQVAHTLSALEAVSSAQETADHSHFNCFGDHSHQSSE